MSEGWFGSFRSMSERKTFGDWWRDVPSEERPGLRVLFGIFLIVMALAFSAALAHYQL